MVGLYKYELKRGQTMFFDHVVLVPFRQTLHFPFNPPNASPQGGEFLHVMAPLLARGAMIQVARRRFYWPGDPLVIQAADGRPLVHRLLGGYSKGQGWCWLTQADNALSVPHRDGFR